MDHHKLYRNPLSRFAGVMAVAVFAFVAVLLLLDYLGVKLNPIIGILTYTLFPGLLLFYLLLIPIGMYREWRRQHREGGDIPPRFPRFDFNVKSQRLQLYVFIIGTSLVGLLVLGVSFRAYEFTESVYFCGELCHKVMKPEHTTYKGSPHAHVTCIQCHVGKGATWYVKSKLSGLYQVYATLFNKYPRPIETPVKNLRPSLDICEQCHWPEKFFGSRQVSKIHYQEDENNTPIRFNMLINVGGGVSPTGIHWHVGRDEVYYIARDKARQDIPWVKVKYNDGKESIFINTEDPPSDDLVKAAEVRKMDCIDCHNRPTHIFKSPSKAMDEAMADGRIDSSLPYIKKLGVELLSKDHQDHDAATSSITEGIDEFYKKRYTEIYKSSAAAIAAAAGEIQRIYSLNNFLGMKSKWSVYPQNDSHFEWPGCFRCHDSNYKNQYGEAIKKDCHICHIFLNEALNNVDGNGTAIGKPFQHPADVGGQEQELRCDSCHSGE